MCLLAPSSRPRGEQPYEPAALGFEKQDNPAGRRVVCVMEIAVTVPEGPGTGGQAASRPAQVAGVLVQLLNGVE